MELSKHEINEPLNEKQNKEEIKEIIDFYRTIITIVKAIVNNKKEELISKLSQVENSKQLSSFDLNTHEPEIFNNNLQFYTTLKEEYLSFANHYLFQDNKKKLLYKSYGLFIKLLEEHFKSIDSDYKEDSFKLGLVILIELLVKMETEDNLEKLYDNIKIAFCSLNGVQLVDIYKVS